MPDTYKPSSETRAMADAIKAKLVLPTGMIAKPAVVEDVFLDCLPAGLTKDTFTQLASYKSAMKEAALLAIGEKVAEMYKERKVTADQVKDEIFLVEIPLYDDLVMRCEVLSSLGTVPSRPYQPNFSISIHQRKRMITGKEMAETHGVKAHASSLVVNALLS